MGRSCQFDVWETSDEVSVGHGQICAGYVVIVCLRYSRVGAGILVFSKQTVDLLAGIVVMAPLPELMPDTTRRCVTRVPPDPYLRLDTNDYSLDPELVGRRVEVRVDQRLVIAVALDTGEIACQHTRRLAKHRTITALEQTRAPEGGSPAAAG